MRGFMHLVRYREAQDLLMETPDSLPRDFAPDAATRAPIVAERAAGGPAVARPARGRTALLAAYDIPVAPVTLAADAGGGRSGGAVRSSPRAAPSR